MCVKTGYLINWTRGYGSHSKISQLAQNGFHRQSEIEEASLPIAGANASIPFILYSEKETSS